MTRSKLYLALQSAVCAALAAWLSISAVGIYREGSVRKAEHPMESIYTPGIIAERFAPAAPLFFVGVSLLIAGLVLGVKDEDAGKPVKDAELNRDLLTAKEQLKAEKTTGIAAASGPVDPPKKTAILQAVILVAAVVLIIAGVFNGSARDVLYKAITICTECIGLG